MESGGEKYRIFKNDEVRYLQSSLYSIRNENGISSKVFGILRDITDEELSREELERTKKSFMQIFSSSPAGIFILDDIGNLTMRNQTFIDFTGSETMELSEFLGEKYDFVKKELQQGREVFDLDVTFVKDNNLK